MYTTHTGLCTLDAQAGCSPGKQAGNNNNNNNNKEGKQYTGLEEASPNEFFIIVSWYHNIILSKKTRGSNHDALSLRVRSSAVYLAQFPMMCVCVCVCNILIFSTTLFPKFPRSLSVCSIYTTTLLLSPDRAGIYQPD